MKALGAIPCLSYRDASKAIDWLCNAFGFEKFQVFKNDSGTVVHAELTLGDTMIMLSGHSKEGEYKELTKLPEEVGNYVTQSAYIVLRDEDVDYHYENAKKHGAKIAIELNAPDYGGKGYSCYDLDGHIWNFGTYNPWKSKKE